MAFEIEELLKCELQGTCLVYHHFLLCSSDSIPHSEIQSDYHKPYIHLYFSWAPCLFECRNVNLPLPARLPHSCPGTLIQFNNYIT